MSFNRVFVWCEISLLWPSAGLYCLWKIGILSVVCILCRIALVAPRTSPSRKNLWENSDIGPMRPFFYSTLSSEKLKIFNNLWSLSEDWILVLSSASLSLLMSRVSNSNNFTGGMVICTSRGVVLIAKILMKPSTDFIRFSSIKILLHLGMLAF